jgi:uncharacterized protein YcfJ
MDIQRHPAKRTRASFAALGLACAAVVLAGCATEPMGPTIQVMPAQNKPFEVFQNDQVVCKQYASQQIAGQVDAANEKGVGAAVLTTALGAGLGAAVGGGRGAAIGAGAGGVVGADVGASGSEGAQHSIQRQYNNAYAQCMYSKGNQVVNPAPRPVYVAPQPVYVAPPPPAYYYPPPPPPPAYYPPPQ